MTVKIASIFLRHLVILLMEDITLVKKGGGKFFGEAR